MILATYGEQYTKPDAIGVDLEGEMGTHGFPVLMDVARATMPVTSRRGEGDPLLAEEFRFMVMPVENPVRARLLAKFKACFGPHEAPRGLQLGTGFRTSWPTFSSRKFLELE